MELMAGQQGQGQAPRRKLDSPPAQQQWAGGQGAGQRDQQTSTAHKIQVKREKPTNDGHKQGAAANTSRHGNNANEKAGDKQGQWPEPPGQT
jgi:hypothetical protein